MMPRQAKPISHLEGLDRGSIARFLFSKIVLRNGRIEKLELAAVEAAGHVKRRGWIGDAGDLLAESGDLDALRKTQSVQAGKLGMDAARCGAHSGGGLVAIRSLQPPHDLRRL